MKTTGVRFGHSDPRMTLEIYARATTPADKAAAKRLGKRFLAPKAKGSRRAPEAGRGDLRAVDDADSA